MDLEDQVIEVGFLIILDEFLFKIFFILYWYIILWCMTYLSLNIVYLIGSLIKHITILVFSSYVIDTK